VLHRPATKIKFKNLSKKLSMKSMRRKPPNLRKKSEIRRKRKRGRKRSYKNVAIAAPWSNASGFISYPSYYKEYFCITTDIFK